MKRIYVIANTNFNIENKDYNNILIENWNSIVNKEDIVYHLGNFGIGTLEELKSLYDKLNGIKYLILGEEDMRYDKDFFDEIGFKEVYEHEIVIGKYVLTYYPKDVLNGMINIYGKDNCEDIVSNFKNKNYVCVSAENINSRPMLLKEEE